MANQVNPPFAALKALDLSSSKGKQQLLNILNQMWVKLGGGSDPISTTTTEVNAQDSRKFVELRQLTKKVNEQALQIEQLKAENAHLLKLTKPALTEYHCVAAQLKRIDSRLKDLELS